MARHPKILLPFLLSVQLLFAHGQVQLGPADVQKQNAYSIENITVSDGLHHNNIYDVLQDSVGFLWLASGNGLQKYDGYTFTFYDPNPSDSTLEEVFGLYEDNNQNLWIQRKTGLSRYRRESDDFVGYDFVNSENDTIPYQVTSIAEDLAGMLWVWIQHFGLYRIDLNTGHFVPQEKVNRRFDAISKQVILKETNRTGIYEGRVVFPQGYNGLKLQYKFAIRRQNGTLEWEADPNPANPENGNRELFLAGDTLILPTVAFNSHTIAQQGARTPFVSDSRPTQVRFSIDLNHLENSLSEGDEVQVRGNIPPLRWGDEFLVNCIIFDSGIHLWIGTDNMGLFRFNLETGEHENFVTNPDISGSISSNQITAATRGQNGELWFGSSSGLNRFRSDDQTFENYYADPSNRLNPINGVHRLKEDGQGNIWTQSHWGNGGTSFFNMDNKKFTHYSTDFGLWFSSIALDRSGIVWLGNEFRGLFKLDPDANKFSAFSIKEGGRDVLEGNVLRTVYEDRSGDIWIGGYLDGLYRYTPQTGESRLYTVDSANRYANIINYIFQDRKGIFWIGTVDGLYQFKPETERFARIEPVPYTYPGFGRTSYIDEDDHGMLWVLTRNGCLVQLNPDTYEAEFFSVFDNSDLDSQIAFCDLVKDGQGFFWIASGNLGLYKFDLAQKEFSIVEKIGKVNISTLYLDKDGVLWCGTVGQGLIRYDTNSDTKIILKEKDGLLSSSIMGLDPDGAGNLWLSSQKGLSRYNPRTNTFKHYFKEDGFLADEFSYQAHTRGKNGKLIFGSMHGVVTFHPDSLWESDYNAPIIFTDFKINNKAVGIGDQSPLKKHISVCEEIVLPHDQNDISITFAALDFSHPERNRYSYYLENFEESWRPPGLERTAYYTNLDPGEYVFRVKGTNSDGVWNEQGASIRITVLPPWWQTGWAYALYALTIALTLYGLRRFELKRVHLENELEKKSFESRKLKEVDEMKSRFFADISHEFRTPLTLILGPFDKILAKIQDHEMREDLNVMQRNAHRLQRLVDQLLDLSRVEAHRMPLRARRQDVVRSVREWAASFVSLAECRNIKMHLDFPQESIPLYFDSEKMEKIVYNLLSNAFKFTPKGGEVGVQLSIISEQSTVSTELTAANQLMTANCLLLSVADSGIGIQQKQIAHIFDRFYRAGDVSSGEQGGTGIGLALVKEFVELHHGEIRVESEPGKGSTFTVVLPLGREHLSDDEVVDDPESKTLVSSRGLSDFMNAEAKTLPAEMPARSGSDRPDVLIVEDNDDMRRYLRNALHQDYDIVEAENGVSGNQVALEKTPDLIVSDIMMPGMDGYELCRQLKTDERTSHIPVILLTARAGREDKLEGLETGADDYLTKPFDAHELRVRARNLIGQREMLRQRFSREITVQPKDITVTSIDAKFLERAIAIVEENISNSAFDIDQFCRQIGMSRSTLNRKLRALTDLPTNEFIRTLRLKRASQLLANKSANVVEIAYEVGFNNPSYFAECFRRQFGTLPSQFVSSDA